MKQSERITKIILILIIFLIACCIKTTSYATNYKWSDNIVSEIIKRLIETNDNNVLLNRDILYGSDYVFCREHGNSLGTDLKPYELSTPPIYVNGYKITQNPITLPINDDSDLDEEIAYVLSEIENYPKATYGKTIQNVIWTLLGQYNISNLNDTEKAIYYKALLYPRYRNAVETFKGEYNQNIYQPYVVEANSELQMNGNLATVGPFKIQYAKVYDDVNKVGFGTVNIYFTDNNNNRLENGITFVDYTGKEFQQATISTGTLNVFNNFYIKVDLTKINSINMKMHVETEEIHDATATVCFVNTPTVNYEGPIWCSTCQEEFGSMSTSSNASDSINNRESYLYKYNSMVWKLTQSNTLQKLFQIDSEGNAYDTSYQPYRLYKPDGTLYRFSWNNKCNTNGRWDIPCGM